MGCGAVSVLYHSVTVKRESSQPTFAESASSHRFPAADAPFRAEGSARPSGVVVNPLGLS